MVRRLFTMFPPDCAARTDVINIRHRSFLGMDVRKFYSEHLAEVVRPSRGVAGSSLGRGPYGINHEIAFTSSSKQTTRLGRVFFDLFANS
jgi:hypothetical protein